MNTTMVGNKTASVGWLAGWAVVSGGGLVVGLGGTLNLLWSMTENFSTGLGQRVDEILFGAFLGLGLGLTLGLAQWIVLRLRRESNLRWIGATVLGGMIGGVAALLFGNTFNVGGQNALLTGVAFALLGAIMGGAQFGLARGVAKNALWILASAVALGVGASIAFQFVELWWGVLGGGAVYGIITAAALWWFGKD